MNVSKACKLFNVNRSAYYAWNGVKARTASERDEVLEQKIKSIFKQSRRTYGSRRVLDELRTSGLNIGLRKVGTVMCRLGLKPTSSRKYKATTNSKHKLPVFENVLARNFNVDEPNKAWVCDITYIATNEGWYYLAVVIDLFSRKVVGFKLNNRMTKGLVILALKSAAKARGYPRGVIVHSDRGSQYASHEYRHLLSSLELIGSMSKKGDCYDNAVAESFFATFKKEYVYQTKMETKIQAHLGSFDYIEGWYNNQRRHSKAGNQSPNEYETKCEQIIKKQILAQLITTANI